MSIIFRILLALYSFCLTIVSFAVIVITFRPAVFSSISDYATKEILQSRNARFWTFIVAFLFLILSLVSLLSGFKNARNKKAVSKRTDVGEIRISLNAIENIALSASKRLIGVKDTKAYVTKFEDGVSVIIKAVILSDVNIPSLSEDIQNKVKNSIEDNSGVKVNEIKVLVDNIHTGYKSRVE